MPHLGPLWSVMLILKSMTCHRVTLRRETNGSCESAEFQWLFSWYPCGRSCSFGIAWPRHYNHKPSTDLIGWILSCACYFGPFWTPSHAHFFQHDRPKSPIHEVPKVCLVSCEKLLQGSGKIQSKLFPRDILFINCPLAWLSKRIENQKPTFIDGESYHYVADHTIT